MIWYKATLKKKSSCTPRMDQQTNYNLNRAETSFVMISKTLEKKYHKFPFFDQKDQNKISKKGCEMLSI